MVSDIWFFCCFTVTELCGLCYISMGQCKKYVTPLLMHWSYVFLALTHRFDRITTGSGSWCNANTDIITLQQSLWSEGASSLVVNPIIGLNGWQRLVWMLRIIVLFKLNCFSWLSDYHNIIFISIKISLSRRRYGVYRLDLLNTLMSFILTRICYVQIPTECTAVILSLEISQKVLRAIVNKYAPLKSIDNWCQ